MDYLKYLYPKKLVEFFSVVMFLPILLLGSICFGKDCNEFYLVVYVIPVLSIIATIGFYFIPIALFFKFY